MKVRKILSGVMFGLACGLTMTNMVSASATITPVAPPANAGSTRFGIQFDDGNGHVIKMLNRNLGTNVAGTGEDSYGYYYQRGNNNGFSIQNGTNSIPLYEVSELEYNMGSNLVQWNSSYDANGYNGSTFIKSIWEPFGGDYWKDGNNHSANHQNLWGGEYDYENGRGAESYNSLVGRKGPCPEGTHVPSQSEWDNLIKYYVQSYDDWNTVLDLDASNDYGEFIAAFNNLAIDFANDFKLPYGGYIDADKKTTTQGIEHRDAGILGYYRSSSPNSAVDPTSRVFTLGANMLWNQRDSMRTQGFNIRCFYDDSVEEYTGSLTITFSGMGGVNIPSSQSVQYNQILSEPSEPTKEGFTFAGWYERNATEPFDFDTPITRNVNLYAHWNFISAATITQISAPWAGYEGTKMSGIEFNDGNGYSVKILDRNLGATTVGSVDNSYGYHFQWGNNYGFPQISCPSRNGSNMNYINGTRKSITCYDSSNFDTYYSYNDHSNYSRSYFIKSLWEPYRLDYWWDSATVNHEALRGGEGDYDNSWGLTSTNDITWRQGPCPRGYHIPSQYEWNELFKHWWNANSGAYDNYDSMTYYEDDYGSYLNLKNSNKNDDIVQDFMDDFKLTFDGYHDGEDGTLKLQGKIGYYWTSSPNTVSEALSRKFTIMPSGIYDDASGIFSNSDSARAYGYSVRCFYDPNPAKYYAYFYDNWNLIGSGSFIEGEAPEGETPTVGARDGYTFDGWRDDSYNQYTNLTMTTVENVIKYSDIWMQNYNPTDKNFYTVRSPISYNISYNINGGTHSNPSSYTIEDYIVLNNPTRIGYTFIGWSGTDIVGTSQYVTIPYGTTGTRNYEANWEINTYTLTLDLGDGRTQTITGHYGDPVTQPQDPSRDGYRFTGWSSNIPSTMPAENQTITAQWEPIEYTLTLDLGDGRTQTITGHYGDPVTQPQDPTRDGYSFAGWDTTIPTTMPAENQTITAQWTKNQTSTNHGGGGGGGGSSLKKDNCPNGDYSDSYYDGTCGMPENYAENNGEGMENIGEGNAENRGEGDYVEEQIDAYTRAYKNGITTMDTMGKANLDGNLTRIAMAKMLSYYATNVLGMKPDETRVNKFNDVSNNLDTQYDNGVTLAYQLGIMGINMPNNEFRPFDLVPRSEFVTALSRMKYGTSDGEYEGTVEFYKNHMELLNKLGIITVTDPEMLELRGYVMLMLMRSAK